MINHRKCTRAKREGNVVFNIKMSRRYGASGGTSLEPQRVLARGCLDRTQDMHRSRAGDVEFGSLERCDDLPSCEMHRAGSVARLSVSDPQIARRS